MRWPSIISLKDIDQKQNPQTAGGEEVLSDKEEE